MTENNHYTSSKGLHLNYSIISNMIKPNHTVLDLGCGDGILMQMLQKKGIKVHGIEIDQNNVVKCLEKGLSVIQGDIDEGLQGYPDNSYDYIILNSTLQSTEKPDYVIKEMLRVGKQVVVSFPNFAYWKVRFYLLFFGKMPKSKMLPFEWFNTPNIHLLTIEDFYTFAKSNNIKIKDAIYMKEGKTRKSIIHKIFDNFFAEEVIFVIEKE